MASPVGSGVTVPVLPLPDNHDSAFVGSAVIFSCRIDRDHQLCVVAEDISAFSVFANDVLDVADHRRRPERALDILQQLPGDLLPTDPGPLVQGQNVSLEGFRQVDLVVIGGPGRNSLTSPLSIHPSNSSTI